MPHQLLYVFFGKLNRLLQLRVFWYLFTGHETSSHYGRASYAANSGYGAVPPVKRRHVEGALGKWQSSWPVFSCNFCSGFMRSFCLLACAEKLEGSSGAWRTLPKTCCVQQCCLGYRGTNETICQHSWNQTLRENISQTTQLLQHLSLYVYWVFQLTLAKLLHTVQDTIMRPAMFGPSDCFLFKSLANSWDTLCLIMLKVSWSVFLKLEVHDCKPLPTVRIPFEVLSTSFRALTTNEFELKDKH